MPLDAHEHTRKKHTYTVLTEKEFLRSVLTISVLCKRSVGCEGVAAAAAADIFFFADGVVDVDFGPLTESTPTSSATANIVGARTIAKLDQSILFSSALSATVAKNRDK